MHGHYCVISHFEDERLTRDPGLSIGHEGHCLALVLSDLVNVVEVPVAKVIPVQMTPLTTEVDRAPEATTGATDNQQQRQADTDFFVDVPAAEVILVVSADHQESALLSAPAGMGQVEGLDEQLSNPMKSARYSSSKDNDTSDDDFVPGSVSSDSDLSEVVPVGLLHREHEQPSKPDSLLSLMFSCGPIT